ncbi:MAG: tetratricopeptide repeat protein, partial [Pseudomonadota bacterium]
GDERAVTTGRLAWEAAPDNADVADTYGWILVSQGRLAEGIKLLKESVRLRPGSPTSLYHLAVAYQRAEEPALARESVQEALKAERFPEREEAQALLRELDS